MVKSLHALSDNLRKFFVGLELELMIKFRGSVGLVEKRRQRFCFRDLKDEFDASNEFVDIVLGLAIAGESWHE
jgi:hypothetical protein